MKKIAILVLAAFLLTLMPMTALAKPDNDNKMNGNKWFQYSAQDDDVVTEDVNDDDDEDEDRDDTPHFKDIGNSWAKGYINKAYRKGLVEGYGDFTFQPNKPVTCLELIKILVATLDKNGELELDDADVDQYADQLKKIPDWGKAYVAAALEAGIILDSEIKTFNPNQGAKRYQVAQYIARILGEDDEEDSIMDFDGLAEDLQAAIEDLGDIDIDVDEIAEDIDALIDDAKVLKEDLGAADEEDLTALISDAKALCDAMDEILAAAEDEDLADAIIDDLEAVAHKFSQIRKQLRAYKNSEQYENRQFADEDQIPGENKPAVKRVKKFGIMQGDDDGYFSGNRVVKRDEIAAMLSRLCEQYFGDFITETTTGVLDDVDQAGDDYSITIITEDEEDATFQITDDTRIVHHKASVAAEDLEDYIGYNVVVVADDDQDASFVKITNQADDDDDDDEEEEEE